MLTRESRVFFLRHDAMLGAISTAQDASPGGMVVKAVIALLILRRADHAAQPSMVAIAIAFPLAFPGAHDA